MRRTISLAGPLTVLALGQAMPAFAQGGDGEWKFDTAVTLVGAAVDAEDEDAPSAPAADSLMASALMSVSRSDTFDNGLTLSWYGAARYDRDAPSRPAFSGVLGNCPAADPQCPRIAGGAGFLSPVSPATGLSVAGAPLREDGFVAVEAASVSLDGPWGQGVIGLDSGAAARLDARAPTVMERVSAFSPGLDPTGLGVTRARNDVTGSSFKATYMSPRWIGFRLGGSYTPKADERTVDYDPGFAGPGRAGAQLEDVWEGAVSFARQFAEQDLRVRTAVTYTTAKAGTNLSGFGDYEAWGAGLELEHAGFTAGVRWLSSNNAWEAGHGDYEAWEAGLVHNSEDWRFGVEAGWAEDSLTGIEGASWLVGATRKFNENLDLGIAWVDGQADLPALSGPTYRHINASNEGLIVELTVRN